MKKPARKSLVKKLDKVFSEYIRNRDGRCVVCSKRESLTCGHLFSRTHYSTRWDEENCWCQCVGCNYSHEMNFEPFRRIVESLLGKEKYDALYARHNTIRKIKDWELQELIEKYSKSDKG